MVSHDDLRAKHPPDDPEEYRAEYSRASLEGDIVELFQAVRTRAGLTHAELADRMGLAEEQVAGLEDFDTIPTLDDLARLSRATGISLHLVAADVADIDLGRERSPDGDSR